MLAVRVVVFPHPDGPRSVRNSLCDFKAHAIYGLYVTKCLPDLLEGHFGQASLDLNGASNAMMKIIALCGLWCVAGVNDIPDS
jgi:hypothetical protein